MGIHCRLDEIKPAELKRCLATAQPIKKRGAEADMERLADFLAGAVRTDPHYMAKLKDGLEDFHLDVPKEVSPQMKAQMDGFSAMIIERIKTGPASPKVSKKPRAGEYKCESSFSLEKEWHVLHYALNGTAEADDSPLSQGILGGKEMLSPSDTDYGPPRYLDAAEVKKIATALSKIDPNRLTSKLDADDAKTKKIYLAHTISRPHDWEHLPELFKQFRAFYQGVASRKNAVILYIE